jgi:hypothetical protein
MSKTITVVRDQHPESPREWENLGVMACWHRRYSLGDKQPREAPDDWLEANAPFSSVVLPLYLYDHSGITMRTGPFGDPWDSGQVGWIVATPDDICTAFSCNRVAKRTRARVEACLKAEVAAYDAYLRGDVWGYVIAAHGDEDAADSCFGFYGDDVDSMKAYVPEELHGELEEAWAARE